MNASRTRLKSFYNTLCVRIRAPPFRPGVPGGGRLGRNDPGAAGAFDQFGKEGGADGAALPLAAVTVGAGSSSSDVHEEAELVVDVELGVSGYAEAHLVALTLLVLLAHEAVKRRAPEVLAEAGVVVRVVNQVARKGSGTFSGTHAADRESDGGVFVAEGQEVRRVGTEERDNHVAGDAHLMVLWAAEDPGQASDKAGVGHGPLDWGREVGGPVPGKDRVHDAFEDRVRSAQGGEIPEHGLEDGDVHGEDAVESGPRGGPC